MSNEQSLEQSDTLSSTEEVESTQVTQGQEAPENELKDNEQASEEQTSEEQSDKNAEIQEEKEDYSNWYIVQTASLYEFKVQKRVQGFIDEGRFKTLLKRVLVPIQQTVEIKNNKRVEKETKIFPGYVFIQMDFDDALAFEIRNLPGVAKFIGVGSAPTPVVEDEILKVLRKVGDTSTEIDVDFEVGEVIKVIAGPFRGYAGPITDINVIKGKLKTKISIFGRETPVELDFDQVEKTA